MEPDKRTIRRYLRDADYPAKQHRSGPHGRKQRRSYSPIRMPKDKDLVKNLPSAILLPLWVTLSQMCFQTKGTQTSASLLTSEREADYGSGRATRVQRNTEAFWLPGSAQVRQNTVWR